MLPGGGYKVKDVVAISAAADAACEDTKLMELAWEVRCFLSAAARLHWDAYDLPAWLLYPLKDRQQGIRSPRNCLMQLQAIDSFQEASKAL